MPPRPRARCPRPRSTLLVSCVLRPSCLGGHTIVSHYHTRSCGGKQAVWVHGRKLAKLATRQAAAMYITIGHWRLAARKCLPGIRSVCNCSCARSHAKSKKLGQKCIVMFLTATAAAAATVFSRRCLVEEHLLRRYWPVLRRWCIRIQGALGPPHGTQILV